VLLVRLECVQQPGEAGVEVLCRTDIQRSVPAARVRVTPASRSRRRWYEQVDTGHVELALQRRTVLLALLGQQPHDHQPRGVAQRLQNGRQIDVIGVVKRDGCGRLPPAAPVDWCTRNLRWCLGDAGLV